MSICKRYFLKIRRGDLWSSATNGEISANGRAKHAPTEIVRSRVVCNMHLFPREEQAPPLPCLIYFGYLCERNVAFFSLLQRRRGTVATVDEEIEFRAVQTASTSSVTRDFASQNVSLRERDCHLPHGGRLKNAPFRLHKPTDKSKFEMQISSSWCVKTGFITQTSIIARGGFPARRLGADTVGRGVPPKI